MLVSYIFVVDKMDKDRLGFLVLDDNMEEEVLFISVV